MYDTQRGVRIAKFVQEGGPDLAVGVHIRSERPEATVVEFRDPLPSSVPTAALSFDSDRWSVAGDGRLRWSGVVEGSLVTTYGCSLPLDVARSALHTAPIIDRVDRAVWADGGERPRQESFGAVRSTTASFDLETATAADCEAVFGTDQEEVGFASLLESYRSR